jgi:hypothetical protein
MAFPRFSGAARVSLVGMGSNVVTRALRSNTPADRL